ncbi:uncharacterized protein LOC112058487 isoform X1 [Bicyclus anynana]|uniref:Uncharacterized protein LOC112058487 isoform X1 n=1 Tax=Bicyclus anynana TaxID=110368 RepID=A0A6J1PB82_BICAN|nr:uncharacterized protein LOC112058487 isoform X1 [Bicyclus anynana]XP_052739454.1 uncharacterized protein LOC112058487 isoform X1 [Bicyclus anynana]
MAPNANDNLLRQVTEKMEKTEETHVDVEETTECDCREARFSVGDALFTSVVVAPQVVSVWRGTWGIMELNPQLFPYAQIYLLGIVLHVCFALIRSHLLARSRNAWGEGRAGRWLRERLICRLYTYIFILACIMHWRGGWGLLDSLVDAAFPDRDNPHRPVMIAGITILLYFCITCLRSSRNLLAPPYFLVTDGKEPTYIFTTRFQTKSSRETALYILDCLFSVTVVGSLVVFVWRGSWALLDIFLYPDNLVKSCWTSLVVGYALVVLTFAAQAPVRWAVAKLQGAPRLLLADVYHLISFLATVNVWRGIWGLLDIYFFPETPKLSNWFSHVISLVLLILLNCSNSVLVRGVYIDAEEPAGDCVEFPCHYLRLFFQKERTKKRRKNLVESAATANARKTEEASVPLQIPEEKV